MNWGDGISWENFANEIIEETKGNKDKISFRYEDKKEIIDHIKKYIDRGYLVDLGCNIGRWTELLKDQFGICNDFGKYGYFGIDQSKDVIDIAKKYHPNDSFYCGFLWNVNFLENKFDIAFSNNVLQHNTLEEKERILPVIWKIMKNGGILFINESTITEDIGHTETQFTYRGWIEFIERYGFKFLESWQHNQEGLDECYIFVKNDIYRIGIEESKHGIN